MSYIGNSPGVASQRVTTTLTATAAQTQFTAQSGYVLGYVDVYLNGAKLVNGSDFEAISGTYITLFAGAAAGDVVELVSYVPRGLSDGYTKAEADSKFLDVGGDTATGNLAFATATLSGNLTLNGGTANGVGYLNGSKVVVAGSALTFDGTVLAAPTLNLTNALGVASGGTGQTTANAALNALLPTQTGNATKYLQTDGTNTTWDAVSLSTADITGVLPLANGGTGATTAAGALTSLGAYAASNPSGYTTNTGTVTSVGGTGTVNGLTLTGTVSTTGNLTLGGTLDLSAYSAAGAFSTLSASGAVTLSGGTANGVPYLNASKVLTSGSALTFDGTGSLGLNSSGNGTIAVTSSGYSQLILTGGSTANYIVSDDPLSVWVGGAETFRATTTSVYTATGINVGIGTSNPLGKLHLSKTGDLSAYKTYSGLGNTGGGDGIFEAYRLDGPLSYLRVLDIVALGDSTNSRGSETRFFTTNTSGSTAERVKINSDGNVGIGTASPDAKIHAVKTDQQTSIDSVAQVLLLENNSTDTLGNLSGIRFRQTNGTSAANSFFGMSSTGNVATRARLVFAPPNPSGNATERMTILSSGFVGINTDAPSTNLTVVGNIKAGYNPSVGIVFGLAPAGVPSNDVNAYVLWSDAASFGNNNGDLIYIPRTSTAGEHRFYTGNVGLASEKVRISNNGTVLIGTFTNTNTSKLVVAGTISQTVNGTQYLVVDQSDIGTAPNEIPLNQYLGNMAYQDSANYYNTGMTAGFRNRIINGAMMIDQRNAGASYSVSGAVDPYVLDRWKVWANGGSGSGASFTVQQSSTAPEGFSKSILITQTGSATPTGIHYNLFGQYIEGQNISDLGWGTPSAKSVTLSFWIRSSLTGTFGGAISNEAQIRSYPFTYTINAANTWEQKIIVVPGDTTGTWLTTSAVGIKCFFDLGTGPSYTGPANTWAASTYLGTAGTNYWVGNNGSTLYITGVQLEKGNIATSFDVRPIGTELALCQRYFVAYGAPISNQYVHLGIGAMYTGTATNITIALPVPMRATPTISKIVSSSLGNVWLHVYVGSSGFYSNSTPQLGETLSVGSNALRLYCPDSYSGGTAGQAAWCAVPNGAQLQLSAELT